ncbi:hypothetical protein [Pseudogracilibacillus auburnensis]|uniref:Outer membrane protein assembly factor BamE (Lipoprotein component of BamABCDE complex) n=1 Tax=Pseudogracilibacillus auburnensis TaxID=1494959 RepID=A0A2V3WF19_9BACI|nr:hypothetical protein [Pseudogracilibacillus auburnensis]MBO1002125.1 hypothetical protein [Pseudogracilibacillus auburnensis]PXW87449.1 hypothetical protein DFR56_10591 [Pseudogracilibacillus auburnensis]
MIARTLFSIYIIFYMFLYLGYILYIHLLRSTYNVVSLSAILLPFFLLLVFQWMFWTINKSTREKKVSTKCIILSVFCLLLPLSCGIMLGINEQRATFTTEKWLDKHEERVYIVDDLLSKHHFIGKTKEEIYELLGEPTETEYFKTENNIVYYLGDERGLIKIDSEWLVIYFHHNIVTKYSVKTD